MCGLTLNASTTRGDTERVSMWHCLLASHFKFLLVIPNDVGRYSELSLDVPVAERVGYTLLLKLFILVTACPESSSKRSISFRVLAEKGSLWWPFYNTSPLPPSQHS